VLLISLVVLLLLSTAVQAVRADFSHTVRRGETLSSIGRLYGVSAYSIAAANALPNANYIRVGQVLTIPTGGSRDGAPGYSPSRGGTGSYQTGGGQWPPPDVVTPRQPRGEIAASAWVSDPAPAQNAMVTIYGKLTRGGVGVGGASMSTNWHYEWMTSWCSGVSGRDGVASCSTLIGAPTPGYYVGVQVSFYYAGQWYYATTGFTPR
jgi:LysM repeat protein